MRGNPGSAIQTMLLSHMLEPLTEQANREVAFDAPTSKSAGDRSLFRTSPRFFNPARMPPKLAVEASPSSPPPSRPSTRFGGSAGLLLLSIAFHLVYLGSIFDIYFKSPVTKGVGERYGVDALVSGEGAPGEVQKEGLAKRVVLIVGELVGRLREPAERPGRLTVCLLCYR
jgi:hypothetical protein